MAAEPRLAQVERESEPVVVREGLTVEEYLAMPETTMIGGRLYMSPALVIKHQQITFALGAAINDFAAEDRGEMLLSPMDCHLPDGSVLQPDVMYVAPGRLEILDRWVMGAPDLVIDVLSPGTRRFDRSKKLEAYERNGVREAWFVDPDSSTVTVFSGAENCWVRERSVLFGDYIPSDVVQIGSGGLEDFA